MVDFKSIDVQHNANVYSYNLLGKPLCITDRKGQITQQYFDALNRKTLSNYLADNSSDSNTYNQYDYLVNFVLFFRQFDFALKIDDLKPQA